MTNAIAAVVPSRPARFRRRVVWLSLSALLAVGLTVGNPTAAHAFAPVAPVIALPAIVTGGASAAGVGVVGACVASVVCGVAVGAALIAGGLVAWHYLDNHDPTGNAESSNTGAGSASFVITHNPASASLIPQAILFDGSYQDVRGEQYVNWTCAGTTGHQCNGVMTVQCQIGGSLLTPQSFTMNNIPTGSSGSPAGVENYKSCGALATIGSYLITGSGSAQGQVLKWAAPWSPRETRTDIRCTDGTSVVTGTVTSVAYVYDGPREASGDFDCSTILPNSWVESITSKDCQVTGTASTCRQQIERHILEDADTAYPDCIGSLSCELYIQHEGTPCVLGATACVDWKVKRLTSPSVYVCRWGPYTLPIANCNLLQELYNPQATPDPKTGIPTVPAPSAPPAPGPDGQTGTAPGTPTPPTSANCPSSWWGLLNPFALFGTLKCAFVPDTAMLEADAAIINDAYQDTAIPPVWSAFKAIPEAFQFDGIGTSCLGPPLTVEPLGLNNYRPLNSCTSPMSVLARISWLGTTIAILLGAAFAGSRVIASAYDVRLSWGGVSA